MDVTAEEVHRCFCVLKNWLLYLKWSRTILATQPLRGKGRSAPWRSKPPCLPDAVSAGSQLTAVLVVGVTGPSIPQLVPWAQSIPGRSVHSASRRAGQYGT